MKYYIYLLFDESDVPFYIGVTKNINNRVAAHKRTFGVKIRIKEIDQILGELQTAMALEQLWIKKYIEKGVILKNKEPKISTSTKKETNCIYCGELTFQQSGKREKKYCSTSCRVMYNRVVGKKVEKIKASALHSETMDALNEMKEMQKQIMADLFMFGQARTDGKPLYPAIKHDTPIPIISVDDEPLSFDKLKEEENKPSYLQLLHGMANVIHSDDKDEYALKIMAATHLPDKQIKDLLTALKYKQ